MRFCDAEACPDCPLADAVVISACLRKKAQFCMALSRTSLAMRIRDALDELSLELMDEAAVIEVELTIPAAPNDADSDQ